MAKIFIGFVPVVDVEKNKKFIKAMLKADNDMLLESFKQLSDSFANDSKLSALLYDFINSSENELALKDLNKILKKMSEDDIYRLASFMFPNIDISEMTIIDISEMTINNEIKDIVNNIKSLNKQMLSTSVGKLAKRIYGNPRIFAI